MRSLSKLEVPEQLRGPWEHALILTYGMDITFFERALWPQFAARCRNKIILADGGQYLQKSEDYAQQKGLVRYLNQSYVVAGIFGPHAYASAHAKLILLTHPEEGRLLVGSGNLHWQGYASGGELFTEYEYTPEFSQALPAFLAVREMLDMLIRQGAVEGTAARHINYMWEQTPWLFQASESAESPVRHNLARSFLDQLLLEVNGEPVEELIILSPFFDRDCIALERLLQATRPGQVTLLVQPGRTSVDPIALRKVLDRAIGRWEIRPFQILDGDTYAHAKCYLLKLKNRALCLQGSPNLSQVAMLLSAPHSNVEIANLLTGPREAFDYLLDILQIDPPVHDLASLKLSYQSTDEADLPVKEVWQLTGGEKSGDRLLLNFQGTLPNLQGTALIIAEKMSPLTLLRLERETQLLELRLSAEQIELLAQPVPLSIQWTDSEATHETNHIFVCNREALEHVLQYASEEEILTHAGGLDLDDKELEELLGELKEALIIDQRSIWQLAGRQPPSNVQDDDPALHLDYAQIDYDMLRQHPKIQQYLHRSASGQVQTHSRLQIILNAITSHFQGLLEGDKVAALMQNATEHVMERDSSPFEEDEDEEIIEEREQQHRTSRQRIERLLKNFIQRFVRGISSPDFQEFAGYEVVAHNYMIFTHFLWRLLAKDLLEPLFVVDALIQSWMFYLGDETQPGYFHQLPLDQQEQVLQLVQDYHNDASTLAALYFSAKVVTLEGEDKQRFALRDMWRELLLQPPFALEARLVIETQRLLQPLFPDAPPSPTLIVNQLTKLACFDTRANFLRELEAPGRYPNSSCTFEKQFVSRHHQDQAVPVDCLVIRAPNALADQTSAIELLQEWMVAEQLDYYRITTTGDNVHIGTTRLIYYDVAEQKGKYWVKEKGGRGHNLRAITLPKREWDTALDRLHALAS
jgi:hypothetical protein